jgi:hypothetical protein
MAAAGIIGGALYNVVTDQAHRGAAMDTTAGLCVVLTIATAIFAGLCLMPRLQFKNDPTSLVYFLDIARSHQGSEGRSNYRRALKNMAADDNLLIEDLSIQIWINARIALQKYRMNILALISLFLSIPALVATATLAITSC